MCRFSKIVKSAKSLHPTAVVLRTPLPKHVSAIPDMLYSTVLKVNMKINFAGFSVTVCVYNNMIIIIILYVWSTIIDILKTWVSMGNICSFRCFHVKALCTYFHTDKSLK